MIKAVLFDWSGTLYGDRREVSNALRGFFLSPGFTKKFFYHPLIKPIRRFFSFLNISFPTPPIKQYFGEELKSKLVDFTEEALVFLKKKKIITAIFSTQSEELIHKVIKDSKLEDYIDYIEGNALYKASRIETFLNKHGLKKNEVLYLSDLYEDIKEIKESGIKTCAVLWGYDNEEKLRLANPDNFISKLQEIKILL